MWLPHHVVASGIEALIVLVRRRAEKLDSRSTKRLKQGLFLKKNRAELEPQHALLGSHFGILDRRLKSAKDLGRRWGRGQNRRGRPRVGEEAGNSSQGERPCHGETKEGQEAGQGGGTARPDAVRQTQLEQPSRQPPARPRAEAWPSAVRNTAGKQIRRSRRACRRTGDRRQTQRHWRIFA